MARRPASSNTLRLIAGKLGGRKIRFPDARGLRPTADRTRETLFNWLSNDIAGSHCLDLFAGSGALGFEAVSRGANHVTMVDASGNVTRQLQENSQLLNVNDRVTIVARKATAYLSGYEQSAHDRPFDIVFLDPPFADDLLQKVLDMLFSGHCLAHGTKIYVERDIRQELPVLPKNCEVKRDKKAGQVAFSLLEYNR
ncbi:MAG: 16S rRNA (guanine(966)-N(2))-methyltransferase RsmD [Gammaproteobacteria bacterium]|nr:16S rRNA (guanine(966)-N(2))-methyltransferase RsmD [Gammaproteobacteria bacterium]